MGTAKDPTQLGIEAPLGGLLCYAPCCIGFLFSIAVIVVEKQNKFLKFHAFQSLLFQASLIAVSFASAAAIIVVSQISSMLGSLASLGMNLVLLVAGLGGTIFLMMKAYAGEEFELPVLGGLAKGWR